MRMMTLYQPEISSRGGDQGRIEPGPAGGGGILGRGEHKLALVTYILTYIQT